MLTLLAIGVLFVVIGLLIAVITGIISLLPIVWVLILAVLLDRLIIRRIIKYIKERRGEDYI